MAKAELDTYAPMGHNGRMQTVVEMHSYASRAEKLLSPQERDAITNYIAAYPLKGDIIAGTGGLRKLRFAKGGRGKSGGVRIIYYYYSENVPVFLWDIYGKNEKSNLSQAERNDLAQVIGLIKKKFRKD